MFKCFPQLALPGRVLLSSRPGATVEEACAAAKQLGLHLPAPNPFIPEDLDLKVASAGNAPGCRKKCCFMWERVQNV